MTLDRLVSILRALRGTWRDEYGVQDSIEQALRKVCVSFTRERTAGDDRLDFIVEGVTDDELPLRIAIEVKTGGGLAELTRQVVRYLHEEDVDALVVVTTRSAHAALATEINGKPVRVAFLRGAAL